MKNIFILSLLLFSFLISGCVGTSSELQPTNSQPNLIGDDAVSGDGHSADGDAMGKESTGSSMDDSSAGSSTPGSGASYVPFTQSAYERARSEGKVIYLEFYANWCPYCKEQKPIIESAFRSSEIPSTVVGFQVNYKDSDTDDSETALARDFGISYQHTRVIISSSGEVLHKSTGVIDKDTLTALLQGAGA